MTAIKNRLKKLERVSDDSTVCVCYPQYIETYSQNLGEDAPLDSQPILTSKPVPDICPDCLKPTEKNSLIVQFVDGTTKDRFPEHWNANRNKRTASK